MEFIKNALREFKHVVWPTREETKKYFVVVLAVLVAFGVYLFAVGNIFSELLFGLKNIVNPSSTTGTIQLPEGLEGLNVQTGDIETTEIPTNSEVITDEIIVPESEITTDSEVDPIVEAVPTEVQ